MHKMHEQVRRTKEKTQAIHNTTKSNNSRTTASKNNNNNNARIASKRLQQRTGPSIHSSSSSSSSAPTRPAPPTKPDAEQQRRIAARAAEAMAKQVRRRRDRRSVLAWGGDSKRKAVIKRYPDGSQEIIVPQNLTPEQEHYEFPPRSRLLKKLALVTSTQENKRSRLNSPPPGMVARSPPPPPAQPPPSPPKPDPSAMDAWFSSRNTHNDLAKQKQRNVIKWMTEMEDKKPSPPPMTTTTTTHTPVMSSTAIAATAAISTGGGVKPSTSNTSTEPIIQFRSEAGKRYSRQSSMSLVPPDENNRKHHVPLRLLAHHQQRYRTINDNTKRHSILSSLSSQSSFVYPNTATPHATTTHPNSTAPTATPPPLFERSSVTTIAELVHMFQNTLQKQQEAANKRMQHLEAVLRQEQQTRQQHCDDLLQRVTRLEQSVTLEHDARCDLRRVVQEAVAKMNQLEQTVTYHSAQSHQTTTSLQQQLDRALAEIESLRR